MRPSSIAPNPVEFREAPPNSTVTLTSQRTLETAALQAPPQGYMFLSREAGDRGQPLNQEHSQETPWLMGTWSLASQAGTGTFLWPPGLRWHHCTLTQVEGPVWPCIHLCLVSQDHMPGWEMCKKYIEESREGGWEAWTQGMREEETGGWVGGTHGQLAKPESA